jgi:hypothetical protein
MTSRLKSLASCGTGKGTSFTGAVRNVRSLRLPVAERGVQIISRTRASGND